MGIILEPLMIPLVATYYDRLSTRKQKQFKRKSKALTRTRKHCSDLIENEEPGGALIDRCSPALCDARSKREPCPFNPFAKIVGKSKPMNS